MDVWIFGTLVVLAAGWFTLRPILAEATRDWNGPPLPPSPPDEGHPAIEAARLAALDEAMNLRNDLEEGLCSDCGGWSIVGDDVFLYRVDGPNGGNVRRVDSHCGECGAKHRIEYIER